ncbi:Protein of unknown function (plasmid) [Magnetospira sp. QH-2]|nr:Protein of unknown function [Magnetospira sp. QH-2]
MWVQVPLPSRRAPYQGMPYIHLD